MNSNLKQLRYSKACYDELMDLPTGDLPKKLLSNMSYKVIVNVNVSSLLYVNKSVKQETDDSSLNSSLSLSLSLSLLFLSLSCYCSIHITNIY